MGCFQSNKQPTDPGKFNLEFKYAAFFIGVTWYFKKCHANPIYDTNKHRWWVYWNGSIFWLKIHLIPPPTPFIIWICINGTLPLFVNSILCWNIGAFGPYFAYFILSMNGRLNKFSNPRLTLPSFVQFLPKTKTHSLLILLIELSCFPKTRFLLNCSQFILLCVKNLARQSIVVSKSNLNREHSE